MTRNTAKSPTLHFEKTINAPLNRCIAPFRTTRGLARWWDPASKLSRFAVGGTATATDLPNFEIAAIVSRQLIVHRFTSMIDGLALWSFVPASRTKTRVVLDHIADGNRDDAPGRTFYWQGLIANLAAVAERRPIPFVGGEFTGKPLPKGVRYRTMEEFTKAWQGFHR